MYYLTFVLHFWFKSEKRSRTLSQQSTDITPVKRDHYPRPIQYRDATQAQNAVTNLIHHLSVSMGSSAVGGARSRFNKHCDQNSWYIYLFLIISNVGFGNHNFHTIFLVCSFFEKNTKGIFLFYKDFSFCFSE